ncbi:mutator type transposase, partial [Tanacetum coccineum]
MKSLRVLFMKMGYKGLGKENLNILRHKEVKEGGLHKVHFLVRQEFLSSAEVKDLVHKHSIETRRELYLKKNDKVRVTAECRGTILVFHNICDVGPSGVVGPSQVYGSTQGGESSKGVKWTKGKIANSEGYESPL